MNAVRIKARHFIDTIHRKIDQLENNTMEGMKEALSIGSIAGSAVASPILFESSTVYWYIDISIFVLVLLAHVTRHAEEIKTYGALVFPLSGLLCFVIYVSARASVGEVIPALPIPIALMTWLTTYSIPQFFQRLAESRSAGTKFKQKDGNSQVYHEICAEPGSIQSLEDYQNRETPITGILLSDTLQDQLLVHIGRAASRQSRMFSAHSDDIDLDEHMEPTAVALERMVSQGTDVFFAPSPQAFLNTGTSAVSGQPFHPQGDDVGHSSSQDTRAVDYQFSKSAGSTAPFQLKEVSTASVPHPIVGIEDS